MVEGDFPKIDGDILFSSEANLLRPVMQVYTGTGFNSLVTGGAGTDEQSFELTSITSTQAKSAQYAKVRITGISIVDLLTQSREGIVSIKAQIKETGQSYADIEPYAVSLSSVVGSSSIGNLETTRTYELIIELTAGMKTNGFQIKVFSKSVTNGTGVDSSFINIQTVQELA